MYAFAIIGDGAEGALERVVPHLDGRVATIRAHGPGEGPEATTDGGVAAVRADTTYVLDDDWRATGSGLSLEDTLDRVAPDHDYAAVLGSDGGELPRIVVDGDQTDGPDPLVRADTASELDVSATVDAIRRTEPYETLESLVAAVERSPSSEYWGAVATFTGRVRGKDSETDVRTRYLEFERYDGVATERMRSIESDLEGREGVLDVRLHHRTGRIRAGDDVVFVVVLAGHRDEAFRAVEDGIDRLKDEVPLFKKEVTDDETFWVHERES